MTAQRIVLVIALGFVLVAAGLGAYVMLNLQPAPSTEAPSGHHGMPVALWIPILFTGVWVPLFAASKRRRRERALREQQSRLQQGPRP